MSHPIASTKVLLVPDPRGGAGASVVPLRRYRIARLRFENPGAADAKPFGHLHRTHD